MMTIENGTLTEVDLSAPHLVFPADMTSIGDEVYESSFCLLNEAETIEADSRNPRFFSQGNCLIDSVTGTLVLGCKNSVIPRDGSVREIGPLAFNGCQGLTSIRIPSGVKALRRMAFAFTSLKQIRIPSSVIRIDSLCFALNPELRHIRFEHDVWKLGTAAFGTRGELSVYFGNDTLIPDSVFNRLTLSIGAEGHSTLAEYARLYGVDIQQR